MAFFRGLGQAHWPLTVGISEEERNFYISKIGNFTLLKPTLNTQVSNARWDIKLNGKEIRKKHVQVLKSAANSLFLKKWISKVLEEAMSKDYEHLVNTLRKHMLEV